MPYWCEVCNKRRNDQILLKARCNLFADTCSYIGREAVWDEINRWSSITTNSKDTHLYTTACIMKGSYIMNYRTRRISVLKNGMEFSSLGLCKSTSLKINAFKKLFNRTCIPPCFFCFFFNLCQIKQNLELLHDISHSHSYFASTSHTHAGDRWRRQQQQSYTTDLIYVPLHG